MFICPGHPLSALGAPPPAGRLPSPADAMAVIGSVIDRPLTAQTIVLPLDDERRGGKILIVHDTDAPDAVLDVVEAIVAASYATPCAALVVASVRPVGNMVVEDAERWLELDELTAQAGIRLIEWFVVAGDGTNRPRELLGE